MNDQNVMLCVERLLCFARENLLMKPEDVVYCRNRVMAMLDLTEPYSGEERPSAAVSLQRDILDPILEYAVRQGLTVEARKVDFETNLMTLVCPLPSVVTSAFDDYVVDYGEAAALEWFYKLCKNMNYLRMVDIEKNRGWKFVGPHGELRVTINLSKPEKDPKEIARLAAIPSAGYPACMLCYDNVGFVGNEKRPSRATLRVIPIILNNENWFFQFSPYNYYEQHCIALSAEHRKMKVDADTFRRLLDFVSMFPNYFLGSNAALPIVGGSILAHDHYQGGAKVLPMFKAGSRLDLFYSGCPGVKMCIVDWYNSVIRISGLNREIVQSCAEYILEKWSEYTDESVGIIAKTDAQHNAVTPIARMEDREYVMDLILRNNRTDDKHPFGIFHPTEDLHNIKKEGIGLIEAMGLFILPGRLKGEMEILRQYMTGATPFELRDIAAPEHPMNKHLGMLCQLLQDSGNQRVAPQVADNMITQYVNDACARILECTAVFKNTEDGQRAFRKFLLSIGITELDDHLQGSTLDESNRAMAAEEEEAKRKKEEKQRRIAEKKASKAEGRATVGRKPKQADATPESIEAAKPEQNDAKDAPAEEVPAVRTKRKYTRRNPK